MPIDAVAGMDGVLSHAYIRFNTIDGIEPAGIPAAFKFTEAGQRRDIVSAVVRQAETIGRAGSGHNRRHIFPIIHGNTDRAEDDTIGGHASPIAAEPARVIHDIRAADADGHILPEPVSRHSAESRPVPETDSPSAAPSDSGHSGRRLPPLLKPEPSPCSQALSP